MRADPRAALAVALRCCRAAAVASGAACAGQLSAALDDVGAALLGVPEVAGPSELEDCVPLACALGSPEVLRCLGDALGPERAAAAASGRFLVCVACASGDAAGVLRALAQPPFSLGRDDALRGRLACGTWGFVPGDSVVGSRVFAHRPCDVRGYGLQPLYTLCAACANDDTGALAALAEPPYSMSSTDVELCAGDHDGNHECVQSVLEMACISGSAAAVRALGQPPYFSQAVHREVMGSGWGPVVELLRACEAGSAAVLDALTEPPWDMGRPEALRGLDNLLVGWTSGTASALRRLREPPYCITAEDAAAACALYGPLDPEVAKLLGGAAATLQAQGNDYGGV
eukprot:m51a1_g5794 hypothetical protein (344) ;mRNA; f:43774-44805